MKDKFDYKHFIYNSTGVLGGFNEFQGHQRMKDKFEIFHKHFFVRTT